MNLSDPNSGQAPFLVLLTKKTRRLVRLQRVHDEYSYSYTYTYEEFLQDIIIENLPTEEEEAIYLTGRAMSIFESIRANIMLAEPSMVATNNLYSRNSTGRAESNVLVDKLVVPKNI